MKRFPKNKPARIDSYRLKIHLRNYKNSSLIVLKIYLKSISSLQFQCSRDNIDLMLNLVNQSEIIARITSSSNKSIISSVK